ncbi:unnamed protein product [Mesocestoides corti]|uniref:Dynein regulatory complex protein 1 n=1 Tax=Mesocestoides corti TaxID=53468 RepID=A0A158QV98_MESCO|nr:unnamed protein product [Mesocestoides corti]
MDENSRKLYLCEEESKDQGPKVDSDDLEERIAARRLRIANRLASMKASASEEEEGAQKKKTVSEEEEAKEAESRLAPMQVGLSMQKIVNLCRNGNAFITNIKVACDARENLRRMEEEELALVRNQKLDAERRAAEKLFEEIEEKWKEVESTTLAHDLHDILEELKTNCAKMIDEKNKLIYEIHLELKAKDDHFVKELRKRSEDVEIMVERMESQMKTMQQAYNFELKEIEKAFLQDRENLLNEQNADWEAFMEELKKKQVDYLEERKSRIIELEDLIKKLRTNHTEEFNALKLRLMTEVQNMETDLQKMKATYQLNLEKLEYNFQVLKRRDEENTQTRSQQKRRITQLQDQLNRIRVRGRKQEETLRHENQILSEDYKKMMEAFRELQKKSKVLIESEERNFLEIWNMNEDELRLDSQKLLDADRIITEQQLGLTWTPPDVSFMKNSGPISLAAKQKRDSSLADNLLKSTTQIADNTGEGKKSTPRSLKEAPPEIVKQFLDMLAFEPEFLIEEKMKRLLRGMPRDNQKLIRLDSVLNVLGVYNEELLDKLFTYFILPSDAGGKMRGASPSAEPYLDSGQATDNSTATATETTNVREGATSGAIRLIDPVDVAEAMHRFAVENCFDPTVLEITSDGAKRKSKKEATTTGAASAKSKEQRVSVRQQGLLDEEMDRKHWQKYVDVLVPEDKKLMWVGLTKALQRYLRLLRRRSELIDGNENLRNQNAELKRLLKLCIESEVCFVLI